MSFINLNPWAITIILAIIACFLIFLHIRLHIRHNRICQNLQTASKSFAAQAKELDTLKKAKSSITEIEKPETSKSIIVAFDKKGIITYTNEYAEEFFGYNKGELLKQKASETILIQKQKDIVEKIFLNPQLYVDIETQNLTKSKESVWISWTNRVVYDDKSKPIEVRSVGFDITKRKKLEEKLKYLTSIDPLTGVLSRQAFLDIAAKEIKRSNRYNRSVSLIVLKLDHFRLLGQEFGYSFGDEALKKTVQICKDCLRDSDYLGRIGDVEFALLLPETPLENIRFLEERLRLKIQEQNLKIEKGNTFITTSFGHSARQDEKDSIDEMIIRALKNLKEAAQKSK